MVDTTHSPALGYMEIVDTRDAVTGYLPYLASLPIRQSITHIISKIRQLECISIQSSHIGIGEQNIKLYLFTYEKDKDGSDDSS